MKPINVAFILLNLVFGTMLGLAVKSFPEWLALELAMVLGAAQAILIALILTGCASDLRSVTGRDVDAPEGFIYYCRANPTAEECGK